MKKVRIGLIGYGGVGRAFLSTFAANRDAIARRHGLALEIVLIRRSRTQAEVKQPDENSIRWTKAGPEIAETVKAHSIDVIVQAIPGNASNGLVARDQIIQAMHAGADVVTATKTPLVWSWREIENVAAATARCIRVSAAAGAALPAVEMCRRGLRSFPCTAVRASLNGTTNFVLTELRAGRSEADAIDLAVRRGICEPNPRDDLSGSDAGMKIVILANLLWGQARTLDEVGISGIGDDIQTRLKQAARRGRVLTSVAIAALDSRPYIQVGLQELEPEDPLARLVGPEKGVTFDCGPCGEITVIGGLSSPEGAAYALLKDIVNLSTGDREIGFG